MPLRVVALLAILFLAGCESTSPELPNNAPVPDAGEDQSLPVGQTVTLDGTGTRDFDGNTISYRWTMLGRPLGSRAELSRTDVGRPSFVMDREGTYRFSLVVSDGVTQSTDLVTITAEPSTTPVCRVLPASLDFGTVQQGSRKERLLTVENIGGGTLSGTVTLPGCSAFSVDTTPTYSLGAGETASFVIDFSPPGTGSFACNLDIPGCDPVRVTGAEGSAPNCGLNASVTQLGVGVLDESSVETTVVVTNEGTGVLTGTLSLNASSDWSIVGSASYSLASFETASFTVRFTPTSVGTQFCEVIGSGDDCTTTLELSAVGLRSLAPFCDVNVTSVDFGDVNFREFPSFDVVVTNLGSENLSGTVFLEDCDSPDFWISTETTYFLLTNEQAVFTVNFLPTAEGPANCTLNLDNVTCDPIPITGNGVDPMTPECVLSVEELDFGGVTIGQTLDLPITVTNGFSGSLTGTPTLDDPDGVFSIVQNPGSFALGADESVEIVVRFSPGADNTSNATLSLGSDCDPVPIVGTGGLAPACSLDTASLAFGAITVGDQENFDIQITNSGGGTLSGTVTTDCPDLTIQGSASYSLNGSESATISFRLIPTSPGSIDCSIDFGVGCADVPVTATVSGVSFVTDLQPQLQAGCGCHGWSYNSARARVNTANPTDSNMLKACTTFHSSRGGPCVSGWASGESNYNLALQWVQQGAFDN